MKHKITDKIDDGGPAFACAAENGHQEGMSLRDYFAGQALAIVPILADKCYGNIETWNEGDYVTTAYVIADKMLQARAGG